MTTSTLIRSSRCTAFGTPPVTLLGHGTGSVNGRRGGGGTRIGTAVGAPETFAVVVAKILDADRVQAVRTVAHGGTFASACKLATTEAQRVAAAEGVRVSADVMVGGLPVFSFVAGGAS